jgi:hypothetical protein
MATGYHMSYGLTLFYLQPDSGYFPALTPAEADTQFNDPEGMKG